MRRSGPVADSLHQQAHVLARPVDGGGDLCLVVPRVDGFDHGVFDLAFESEATGVQLAKSRDAGAFVHGYHVGTQHAHNTSTVDAHVMGLTVTQHAANIVGTAVGV